MSHSPSTISRRGENPIEPINPIVDGTARTKRALIVSEDLTFRERAGNSAYLAAFCLLLRSLGYRVSILVYGSTPSRTWRSGIEPQYLAAVDDILARNTLRVGRYFLSMRLRTWLRILFGPAKAVARAGRAAILKRGPRYTPWELAWPNERETNWVRKHIGKFNPDLLIANYFNAAPIFGEFDRPCKKAILVHDVFSSRRESYRAAGLPFDIDQTAPAREIEAFAKADLCLTITPSEADFIRRACPRTLTAVLPHVLDAAARSETQPSGERCIFVGSNNDSNRRGAAWLLREVWPQVLKRRPNARLRLIGRMPLEPSLPLDGVEVAGLVGDLDAEYSQAKLALVPLLAGSGLKIKLVEALAHGVPVVATTCGAEGVPMASSRFLQIHDDAAPFAAAICEMIAASDWRTRSRAAASYAKLNFSTATALKLLNQVL